MSGYRHGASHLFTFFAINLLNHFACVTFAMCCVCIRRSFSEASLIANVSVTFITFSCGFFIQSASMPVYVRWIKYISYTYWGFSALCSNGISFSVKAKVEFNGHFFDCPFGDETDPACAAYTGTYIMDQLGISRAAVTKGCIALAAISLIYIVSAWLFLLLLPVQTTLSKQVKGYESALWTAEISSSARTVEQCTRVSVRVKDLTLWIDKWTISGKTSVKILEGITADFEPGKLNVIMGPSGRSLQLEIYKGSGKSSLLSVIGRRIHGSLTSRYHCSGELLFNNTVPSDNVIRALTSYVIRDDALLPSLTVRETLHFAAILRLPSHMSKDQKLSLAERVLQNLGLSHCAGTLIGSEFRKGISGGEKHRVCIALQLLTDPKILILDEPTSGLDTRTAHTIMELLHTFAMEGRTVICTIHQSRTDLFPLFGNLLLLANGRMIYSGEAKNMIHYFAGAGYKCPEFANPRQVLPELSDNSDFALELCSVDLQQSDREMKSRRRVERLVVYFATSTQTPQETKKAMAATLPAQFGSMQRQSSSFLIAYPALLKRSYLNFKRSPGLVVGRIMQASSLGIILALFFPRLGNDYVSVQNRVGYLSQITSLVFVGMLVRSWSSWLMQNNLAVYPDERDAFYREYEDCMYRIEPFFLAYLTLEIPFEIVAGFICTLFLLIPGFPSIFPLVRC